MANVATDFGPGVSELSSLKSVDDADILGNTEVCTARRPARLPVRPLVQSPAHPLRYRPAA